MLSLSDIGVLWPCWLLSVLTVRWLWNGLWKFQADSWLITLLIVGGTVFLTDYGVKYNPTNVLGGSDNINATITNAITREIAVEEGAVWWIPQMFSGMPAILHGNYGPKSQLKLRNRPERMWMYLITLWVWPFWVLWRWGESKWKWAWGAGILAAAVGWMITMNFWWILMAIDMERNSD